MNQPPDGGVAPLPDHPSFNRGDSLLRALSNTGITVIYLDKERRVVWCENLPPSWSPTPIEGRLLREVLPAGAAASLIAAKQEVLATGASQFLEFSIPNNGETTWFKVWMDADRSPEGGVQGLITTAVDITAEKQREQTLRVLLREVSHRSRNLLAIIQGIATQTEKYSGGNRDFTARFRGRLQALAAAQDLVTSSNWRGATLNDLIVSQLGRYVKDLATSIHFEGDNPWFTPNAALHVGLALHELAVNSVSFGALTKPDGLVSVTAQTHDYADLQLLDLVWREKTVARHSPQKRFGRVTLERIVPAALNGESKLEFSKNELTYCLTMPQENFDLRHASNTSAT